MKSSERGLAMSLRRERQGADWYFAALIAVSAVIQRPDQPPCEIHQQPADDNPEYGSNPKHASPRWFTVIRNGDICQSVRFIRHNGQCADDLTLARDLPGRSRLFTLSWVNFWLPVKDGRL
ncbi:MAG: hypothetical protein VCD66_03690 [Alphaproteobacteria bacterium]